MTEVTSVIAQSHGRRSHEAPPSASDDAYERRARPVSGPVVHPRRTDPVAGHRIQFRSRVIVSTRVLLYTRALTTPALRNTVGVNLLAS